MITYITVTALTRRSGLRASDLEAVFAAGPATLIYAVTLGVETTRHRRTPRPKHRRPTDLGARARTLVLMIGAVILLALIIGWLDHPAAPPAPYSPANTHRGMNGG